MNKTLIIILVIGVVALVLYIFYRKNFKKILPPSVCLITGGVKTGKSLLSTKLSAKDYKRRHRKWWIKKTLFNWKKKEIEEPLFYTNVFIQFGHFNKNKKISWWNKPHRLDKNIRQIELEHLLRKKRFNYGSVVYIQESSLMSDNQDFNNEKRNAELSMFNKLFGHETKGGVLYYDTQSVLDNHYAIKRVVSTFFFIQKSINLFLFRVLYVREFINMDIGQNNLEDDIDCTTRKVLIGRWWYKKYDRYYFSYLTDDLSKESKEPVLYTGGLLSFNPLYRRLSNTNERDRIKKVKEERKEVVKNEEKMVN